MKFFFTGFFILYLFSSFTNGLGTAILSCKSASGRTIFKAELEEYTSLREAKLIIDKDTMYFSYRDYDHILFDPESRVFTLQIESEAYSNFDTLRYVKLWAIPDSFKNVSTEGTTFSELYKFTAKMEARDPRKGKEYATPTVKLNCTLGYNYP